MNKQKYYKVLGKVEENQTDVYYILCYTASKKAALAYYLANAWTKEQISFAAMQAGGESA